MGVSRWIRHGMQPDGASLMTPLGIVEGEVLLHLERYGATTLRQLVLASPWPARMVMMGVGALIRDGLVRGLHRDSRRIVVARVEGWNGSTSACRLGSSHS